MSWLPLNRGSKVPKSEVWHHARKVPLKKMIFTKPQFPCTDLPLSAEAKKWYEMRKAEAGTVPDGSRKRKDRQKLIGYAHCSMFKYFDSLDLSPDSKRKKIDEKSFWRFKKTPVKTPEHYWEVEFPSTPECIRRGYQSEYIIFSPFQRDAFGKSYMKHVAKVYPDGKVIYMNKDVELWAFNQKPPYTKELIASQFTVSTNGVVSGLKDGDIPLKLKEDENAIRKLTFD